MTDLSRVHLIGIGGAGMSGVAHILLDRGATVTGSDAKDSRPVRALKAKGAKVALGHDEAHLELSGELPTAVVTSFAAIPQDNPELVRAKREGVPLLRRSDLLAELMEGRTQLLLAGTHGKTSTTSMAVVALQAAGQDPSFAIGGQLNRAGTNAHHGQGEVFVAEADESDASLLRYSPDVAVITNIEPDHLDFYGTREAYFKVFDDFADIAKNIVVCLDDEHAAACGERAIERGLTVYGYGTEEAAKRHPSVPAAAVITEERQEGEHTAVGVRLRTPDVSGEVTYSMAIPGRHMVLNSAAALLGGVHYLPANASRISSARIRRSSPRGSASSRACAVVSSTKAASARLACTTTTPTTRPRWRRCLPRPATRWKQKATVRVWSCASSHTCTRAPRSSLASLLRHCRWQTSACC